MSESLEKQLKEPKPKEQPKDYPGEMSVEDLMAGGAMTREQAEEEIARRELEKKEKRLPLQPDQGVRSMGRREAREMNL